jgi:hypothetical protein
MSPALKASPSAFFQPAIPPSVMVGDIAGILNELEAYLTTVSSIKAISQALWHQALNFCGAYRFVG